MSRERALRTVIIWGDLSRGVEAGRKGGIYLWDPAPFVVVWGRLERGRVLYGGCCLAPGSMSAKPGGC